MWLLIEGEVLVNLDLIDKVELRHAHKIAILWTGGVNNVPESHIAYQYFTNQLEAKPNVINAV